MSGVNFPKFEILEVDGVPPVNGARRAVGFLVRTDEAEKFLNANIQFEASNEKIKNALRTGMAFWQQEIPSDRYHGWDSSQFGGIYKNCFVFKFVSKQVRLYGYIIHPEADVRSIICCLMHQTTKKENGVDTTLMNKLNDYGTMLGVKKAAEEYYERVLRKKGG